MLFHATKMSHQHQKIIINSDDTDVLVLMIYYFNVGMLTPKVYKHTGRHTNRERFISVHDVA